MFSLLLPFLFSTATATAMLSDSTAVAIGPQALIHAYQTATTTTASTIPKLSFNTVACNFFAVNSLLLQ